MIFLLVTLFAVLAVSGSANAEEAEDPFGVACASIDGSAECAWVAASVTGDAESGIASASVLGCAEGPIEVDTCDNEVAAEGQDDAEGGTLVVSGTGNASCRDPYCAALSGTGDAEVGHQQSPTCVAVDLGYQGDGFVCSGHPGAAASVTGNTSCRDGACVASSGTGDAEARTFGVSGTGDAEAGPPSVCVILVHGHHSRDYYVSCIVLAVSGAGDASTDRPACQGVTVDVECLGWMAVDAGELAESSWS